MFGLKEADVATLVRAVAGPDLARDAIRDRFARATWTGIAEPGDGTAGLAIQALGAARSLDAIVTGWDAARWANEVRESGADTTAAPEWEQAIARWQPRLTSATALLALRQAARFGVRLLVPETADWPSGVDDLGVNAPTALWMRGREQTLAALGSSVALVGARASTGYGEHLAIEAAAGLVDRGYAIVSGAAYGIDGAAHRAALMSHGQTVAFLAGGVDRFYPAGHDSLLTKIVEEGAVISELPCGSAPTKWRFLQRNRLIAASSQATIVLEAGWRSGSLNTAGHAAALGRPVGAVPGPVMSAASAGCHRLVRELDAILVTTPDEMAELMPDRRGRVDGSGSGATASTDRNSDRSTDRSTDRSAEQTRVLDAMSFTSPRSTPDIAARCGLSVAGVQAILGALELESVVAPREHGWSRLRRPG